MVGETVTCNCYSDIGSSTVRWYEGDHQSIWPEDVGSGSGSSGSGSSGSGSRGSGGSSSGGSGSGGSDSVITSTGSITIPVTTDRHGQVYTCSMSSSCGTQETSVTLDVAGMWFGCHHNSIQLVKFCYSS